MSIIMENAIRGAKHQRELAIDLLEYSDDIDLAEQHWQAALLLEDFSREYIPIEGEL